MDERARRIGDERVTESYRQGMLEGKTPDLPVSYEDLREAAHEAMSPEGRAYVHGGAGSEETFGRGTGFSAWRLVPRMLRGVETRNLSVDLLGREFAYPLALTPLGVQTLLHETAEEGTRPAVRLRLAAGGAEGVKFVLQNLLAELDLTMGLSGRRTVEEIDRDSLRRASDL